MKNTVGTIPHDDKYLAKGRTKVVYLKNGYVYKYLRETIHIDPNTIRKEIAKRKENMGKYIPDTSLEKDEKGAFYIKQTYIPWKTLKNVDIKTLSKSQIQELIDFVEKYILHCKKEWLTPDFIGDQWIDNLFFAGIELIKRLPKNILSSSNIVFGDDWHFYLVDVVDIDWATTPFLSFLDKISQKILGLFVKNTIRKLKRLEETKNDVASKISDTLHS